MISSRPFHLNSLGQEGKNESRREKGMGRGRCGCVFEIGSTSMDYIMYYDCFTIKWFWIWTLEEFRIFKCFLFCFILYCSVFSFFLKPSTSGDSLQSGSIPLASEPLEHKPISSSAEPDLINFMDFSKHNQTISEETSSVVESRYHRVWRMHKKLNILVKMPS